MSKRRLSLFALVGMLAGLLMLPAGTARAQTTYEIGVGQEFFDQGVPGFSGRFYPGSIKVHDGDMLHFDFPAGLGPQGRYPQEDMGAAQEIGAPGSFFLWDPDDGPQALKASEAFFEEGEDCGTQDNPCVWGPNDEVLFPAFPEEPPFDVFVLIDAEPGTTLWAGSVISSDANVNFKVEVVPGSEDPSTQEQLDVRADRLRLKDFEDAHALHRKMRAKRTFHLNAAGRRVYDVFVGASGGPIELFASYPRRTVIPRRSRVQFHFMSQVEPHTATFGGPVARDVFQNFIIPACDPDGDEGEGPDVDPIDFDEETGFPICPEGTELEADFHELLPWAVGNGRVTGRQDYENSGLVFPQFPDESAFDQNPNPYTLRFPKATNKKGFRFTCLVHGAFMGGRVAVRG